MFGVGSRLVALAGAAALLAAAPAAADFVTVGTYNAGGNSSPFGSVVAGESQQIYASSAFNGPVTITSLGFAAAPRSGLSGLKVAGNIVITLSTTATAVDGLSTDLSRNRGADEAVVYSGAYAFTSKADGTFDLVFATAPFAYDPARGNLLMDVTINPTSGGTIFFSATHAPGLTSRAYRFASSGVDTGYGLVTQIGVAPAAAATPAPASAALLAIGLAGTLGAAASRRRGVDGSGPTGRGPHCTP